MGYYKDEPASHINTAQNVVTTQGVGWYKLVFTPPANVAGMESFLQFDAASRIATVWLNGTMLGTHRGGFSRFRLDSTAALKPGQENSLTVKVDNTKPALGSATADVLPLTGDFFVYGGLYRPVRLVFTRNLQASRRQRPGTRQIDAGSPTPPTPDLSAGYPKSEQSGGGKPRGTGLASDFGLPRDYSR